MGERLEKFLERNDKSAVIKLKSLLTVKKSWSDLKRKEKPYYFCEKAIENINVNQSDENKFKLCIITDARRQTDLNYFKEKYPNQIKTVRILAEDHIRTARNWKFTTGKINSK